jgi:hypothetical protein
VATIMTSNSVIQQPVFHRSLRIQLHRTDRNFIWANVVVWVKPEVWQLGECPERSRDEPFGGGSNRVWATIQGDVTTCPKIITETVRD